MRSAHHINLIYRTPTVTIRVAIVGALLGLGFCTTFAATSKPVVDDIQVRYTQERAKCLSGESNQDRTTCLKEAGAARDQARRGQLGVADTDLTRNAKARCDALAGDEARDCRARMNGAGTTSGSAAAGGIYRETVTREVKPADPAPAASAPG